MELIVKGVPEQRFKKALEYISKKLPELEEVPNLKIYVVYEGDELKLPMMDLPLEVAIAFGNFIASSETSFSLTLEDQNLILIKITPEIEFILNNNLALTGLLVHELMHSIQRHRGLDENLKSCFRKELDIIVEVLQDLPYSKKNLIKLMNELGKNSILVLKDLYSNEELIKKSFTRELIEYYTKLFGVGKVCPLPDFYETIPGKKVSEKNFPLVLEALTFELQLFPAWLPFEKTNRKAAQRLKQHIENCYEHNLGYVAKHFHELVLLYITEFSNTCEFHRDFYRLILNRVYAILAGIDHFTLHLIEATDKIEKMKIRDDETQRMYNNILKSLYLHISKKKYKRLEIYLNWITDKIGKRELNELKKSKISKTSLLKVPILWSLKKARLEFSKHPRSDFIDIAYSCTSASADVSEDPLFEEASLILSKLDVHRPYLLMGDLMYTEFLFEKEIYDTAPEPRLAYKLMEAFQKEGILPTGKDMSYAKDVLYLGSRSKGKPPNALIQMYPSLSKPGPNNKKLLEICLKLMKVDKTIIARILKRLQWS